MKIINAILEMLTAVPILVRWLLPSCAQQYTLCSIIFNRLRIHRMSPTVLGLDGNFPSKPKRGPRCICGDTCICGDIVLE